MNRLNQITFLHGRDELPNGGTVERLETVLRSSYPRLDYARPLIPSDLDAKQAADFFERYYLYRLDPGSLLVGVERGGLIACAVQSAFPALKLSVVAINSPTEEDGLVVPAFACLALYSSAYEPIKGRCDWKSLTPLAYDVPWLSEGCENRSYPLSYLISSYSHGGDMGKEVSMLFPKQNTL